MLHGAQIKPGDLVVRLIGGDVSRSRKLLGQNSDPRQRQSVLGQPRAVFVKIFPRAGQYKGCFSQKGEIVGDISGSAAKFSLRLSTVKQTFSV